MVDRRFVLDENIIARVGMLIAGGYTLYIAINEWSRMGDSLHPYMVLLSFLTYLLAFGLIVLSISGFNVPHAAYWILFAFVFALVIQFYMQLADQPLSYSTDNLAFTHYSAQLFLQGKNPYVEDVSPAFSEFKVSPFSRTPTLDGTDEALLTYPALHFILYIPYILAGIDDMHLVVLTFHLLVMLMVFFAAPPALRPLVLIPFFIDPSLVNYSLATVSDFIWVFFTLTAAVLFRRHRTASALFYGLSCSIKQMPWFLAPFLAIMIWRESGLAGRSRSEAVRSVLTYLNIAFGVFVLINLPFILWAPVAWFHGVLSPLIDPLIMYGQGLSTLSQTGLVPLGKSFYTAVTLSVIVLLLIVYWKEYARLKHTFWFFPAIILWFSYRSLQSYFVYLVPLVMVELFELMRERPTLEMANSSALVPVTSARPRFRLRVGLAPVLATVVLGTLAGCGGYFAYSRQELAITPTRVFLTSDSVPAMDGIQLHVTNPTGQTIQPHFWVKMTGNQMLSWNTSSGPAIIGPGHSADFTINSLDYAVPFGDTATVILMNSASNAIVGYSPAFVVNPSTQAGLINPDFKFWRTGQTPEDAQPLAWAVTAEGNATLRQVSAIPAIRDGRTCLNLTYQRPASDAGWGRLVFDQWADFPTGKLRVDVFPETLSTVPEPVSSSSGTPTTAFGLEILSSPHRLWYLFSGSKEREWTDGNYAYHLLPAPKDQWSSHTIDIAGDFSKLGWGLPPMQPIPGDVFNLGQRRVNFRFFVGTSNPNAATYGGCVAPVLQVSP